MCIDKAQIWSNANCKLFRNRLYNGKLIKVNYQIVKNQFSNNG